jgi:hypothetical protein
MKEFTIEVKHKIKVTIDTDEFKPVFYSGTLEDSAKHLAQIKAASFINIVNEFIDGYGPIKEMGITVVHKYYNEVDIL